MIYLKYFYFGFTFKESSFSKIISWNDDGTGFIVKKVTEFTDQVLPKYFKHKNFASFVRQLNMYDFHKAKGGKCFTHIQFRRGMKHLIKNIKRKIGATEKEDPQKKGKVDKSASTLKEHPKRLSKLEKKEQNYETLLNSYKEMKEKNQQLENIFKCFAQTLNTNYENHRKDGNNVEGSLNQSPYTIPMIRTLLPEGNNQHNQFPSPSSSVSNQQCKALDQTGRNVEELKNNYEKRVGDPDNDDFYIPEPPKVLASPSLVSPEITPMGFSPLEGLEHDPGYLKGIELSPPITERIHLPCTPTPTNDEKELKRNPMYEDLLGIRSETENDRFGQN